MFGSEKSPLGGFEPCYVNYGYLVTKLLPRTLLVHSIAVVSCSGGTSPSRATATATFSFGEYGLYVRR